MRLHRRWFLLPFLCLSCTTLRLSERPEETPVRARGAVQEGEVRTHSDSSVQVTPVNQLRLAVDCLDRGDVPAACSHLADFLTEHPDQAVVRTRYAELLIRLHRYPAARSQFQRIVADAQEDGPDQVRNLIHCHRRLMDIAAADEDDYAEHLHRGIGLYLLARERERVGGLEEELPAEALFCKAAAELTLAQAARDSEARAAWYLYCVWAQLGQQQAARRSLRLAVDTAPFAYLTPSEQRGLYAAEQKLCVASERP